MGKTDIEWATDVWNPVTGCKMVSSGCANCYAERMAGRLKAMGQVEYQDVIDEDGRWTGTVTMVPERLGQPLTWRKPRRVFVNSMSDLFHPMVPFDFVYRVFDRMAIANQHTFMILTKRPGRMLEFFGWLGTSDIWNNRLVAFDEWPLKNVWLGVSVENQTAADQRISLLLEAPAAVRFLSCEPLIGPVTLFPWLKTAKFKREGRTVTQNVRGPDKPGLDWVIAGCESGPGARECQVEWVRKLRDECGWGEIPFFLKQLQIGGKLVKTPALDGQTWTQYPGGER